MASRTRAHMFVVMLAYLIMRELASRLKDIELTVEKGIRELGTFCVMDVMVKGELSCRKLPKPSPNIQKLLDAAQVTLPEVVLRDGTVVATTTSPSKTAKPR
ncbi:MAG: hypothetical protein HQK89_06070 [Nitrospirae bacterium]|nr:hypothetical protein [Nitrospirota bacterium]